MKRLFTFFFFICISINAQDFSTVDNIVNSYPRYTNPENLASKIASDFKNDTQKARAIFKWLANNIRYNLEEYYNPKISIRYTYTSEDDRLRKIQAIKDKIVKDAFLTKMGVCEEYAQSFKKVADLVGLEAQVIKGNVRNSAREIGQVPRGTNHAWNAVKIDNRWVILDATWAAGFIFNGRWMKKFNGYFFDIDHKKIGRTHYPDDIKWQALLNSGKLDSFYDQPIYAQTFLSTDLELISPKKGSIQLNRTKKVQLKIKNLSPSQRIYYNYKGQRYSKKPEISYEGNVATVSIENPGKNTELYLFLNRFLALEYKVLIY